MNMETAESEYSIIVRRQESVCVGRIKFTKWQRRAFLSWKGRMPHIELEAQDKTERQGLALHFQLFLFNLFSFVPFISVTR